MDTHELEVGYRSTREVARLLGISVSRLSRAVWVGRIAPPARSPSGNFLWHHDDIERASWVLLRRALGDDLGELPVEVDPPRARFVPGEVIV